MKKLFTIIFAGSLLFSSIKTFAQKETKKWSIGILTESGLPLGDAKNIYQITSGLSLRFSYHVGPGFVTLSGGAVAYIPKNIFSPSSLFDTTGTSDFKIGLQIPIKVGYKFIFDHHFFVMAEIGNSIFRVYYDDGSGHVASTKLPGGFTFAGSAGFQFGSYEIGFKYETIKVTGGSISNIGLRTGFNF
jgi:hypothetical protein